MLDSVLRVYGEQFDVDSFLNSYNSITFADAFHQGDPDMLGNSNEFSGFDVIVAENEGANRALEKIEHFIQQHTDALNELNQLGVNCVLDIDVTVNDDDQVASSIGISAEFMATLSQFNISVEFSAYPDIDLTEQV